MNNKEMKKELRLHPFKVNLLMILLGGLVIYGVMYVKGELQEPNNGTSYTNSYFYKPRIGPVDESRKFSVGGDHQGSTDMSDKEGNHHTVPGENRNNERRSSGGGNNNIMTMVNEIIDAKLDEYTNEIQSILTESTGGGGVSSIIGVGSIAYSVMSKCPAGYLSLTRGTYSGPEYTQLVIYIKDNLDTKPSWLNTIGSRTVVVTDGVPDDYFLKIVSPSNLDKGEEHASSVNVDNILIKVGSTDVGMVLDGPASVVSRAGSVSYDVMHMKDALSNKNKSAETEPRHIRTILCMKY